jgi:hypothetical protein
MRYWPNPAHKKETTEAGPPAWHPDKEACPDDLSVAERDELLEASVPHDPADATSRRWTVRRGPNGLELYDIKHTGVIDGTHEFHGHPATYVPAKILKVFRDDGLISRAEYGRLVRELGCP